MRFSILSAIFLASTAFAAPVELVERQNAVTCGNTYYSYNQVKGALNEGYGDYRSGSAPGGYPHQYNNYEGFTFQVSGPYQEFPIKTSGPYRGGSPGPDRVIFNTRGQYAGSITHTGASGNNFVGCSDTD